MDLNSNSQDEYCIIQPDSLLSFDNVEQYSAAVNLRAEPIFKRPPPISHQIIAVQVTCNYIWLFPSVPFPVTAWLITE